MESKPMPFTPVDHAAMGGYQFAILTVCVVTSMLDGFDILLMAFTAPAIAAEWSVGSAQLGLVFSASLLGMMLGAMFFAQFADRYGRRTLISIALLVTGGGTFVSGLTETVNTLMAWRFVTGLGLGTLLAVLFSYAGEYAPARHRNLVVAIVVSATSIGAVIGGLISAAVIAEYGWRSLFYGGGILTLFMAVVFACILPESLQFYCQRRPAQALQSVNRILARLGHPAVDDLPDPPEDQHNAPGVRSLLLPERRAITLFAWTAYGLAYATSYFLHSWTPKLVVDVGGSTENSIHAAVTLTLGSAIGGVLIAWLSGRWNINRLISMSFFGGAVFTVLCGFVLRGEVNVMVLWILLAVMGFLINGAFTNLTPLLIQVYPTSIRSTGIGWCIGVGRVGAVLSPALAGAMLSYGLSVSVTVMVFALPMVIAGVLALKIRAR